METATWRHELHGMTLKETSCEGVASKDRINHPSGGFFKLESQNGSFHFSFPAFHTSKLFNRSKSMLDAGLLLTRLSP